MLTPLVSGSKTRQKNRQVDNTFADITRCFLGAWKDANAPTNRGGVSGLPRLNARSRRSNTPLPCSAISRSISSGAEVVALREALDRRAGRSRQYG